MSKPRVLINALSMSGGGAKSHVVNLLRELGRDDRGIDATLLVQPGSLDGVETHGVPVREVGLPARGRVLWRVGYEELVLPFVAGRFDLLYCIGDLAPRFAAAPRVVLISNLNIYDRRWYDDARTRTLARLVRLGLPGARRLIFPSQAAADAVAELVPLDAEKLRVVHYGVDLEAFASPDPAPPARRPYIFLPAAIEKHKNIGVLIEGLAQAADRELELRIAGTSQHDPGHRSELERLAERVGVGSRVHFLGPVPYRELLGHYRGARALAFPSLIETFGMPLLEALAAGTPALASDIPVFREIAGDAVLYFAPGDPASVASALDRLHSDSIATQQRVEIGLRRASELSWRASVDGVCAVLREAIGPVPDSSLQRG